MLAHGLRARLLQCAIPIFVIGSLADSAIAQTAGGIETVTVTAEKRAENIQNVPIAITAFTGADLKTKDVVSLNQLSNLTPNVNLDAGTPFSGDSSVLSASIRGIGSDDFAFNIDPGVGVYLDGVYLARTIGANVDLLDVSRIEVAKGPQGTLFGRNTIGGAINIVTRDPGDAFTLEGEGTTGSFNRFDLAATADIPLADNVRTSLTVSEVRRDGYQRVVPYNNVNNYAFDPPTPLNGGTDAHDAYGGQNRFAARGKLVWDVNNNFNVMLTGDWNHEDQESTPVSILQTWPNTPDAIDAIAGLYTACLEGAEIGVLCSSRRSDGYPSHGGLAPLDTERNLIPINAQTTQTGNIDTTYANGPNFAKYDSEGTGLTMTWVATPDLTLKSITGYRHITWNIGTDLDGAADNGELLSVTDKQRQQQFSEELQAIGTAFDQRLNYVGGLYYFYEDGFVHDWVPFDGSLLAVDDLGLNDLRTKSYAAYFHLDYKVTDQLGVTVGGRYSIEKKAFLGGQQDNNGLAYKASGCYPPGMPNNLGGPPFLTCQQLLGFPDPNEPFRYFPGPWDHQNFYLFTPTVGTQYHFTDDLMTYVSWSKGFKSGGWTTRLSDPITDPADARYGPEKASTYEAGLKSDWLDHRLIVNAAAFFTYFTGIQLNQQQGASPVLENLGNAHIKGFEVESQAEITDNFMVRANIGYTDAYYTHLDPAVVARDSLGNIIPEATVTLNKMLPKTPKWKISINPQYDIPIGNGDDLLLQAAYTHISREANDAENTPLLMRPAVDLLDLSVRYAFHDDKYAVTLGGTNVGDKRYITIGSHNYAAGFVDATYDPPAQWYAKFDIKM
ncbi:MAG TPA: TonB-dependent receptor [Rhizomicrobium sp.]|jgi:iron complex outermembrane receptor protein